MSDLVARAEEVARKAYAPYSNYLVGAVVRTTDGREFTGTNVENAAYPLTQCAEKTAIGAAATAGYRPGDIAVGRDQRVAVRRLPAVALRVARAGGVLPPRRRVDRHRQRRRPAARHVGARRR